MARVSTLARAGFRSPRPANCLTAEPDCAVPGLATQPAGLRSFRSDRCGDVGRTPVSSVGRRSGLRFSDRLDGSVVIFIGIRVLFL